MNAVENPGHIAQQVNLTPSSEEGDSFQRYVSDGYFGRSFGSDLAS